jgi:soluble lytic murein transglycosylase
MEAKKSNTCISTSSVASVSALWLSLALVLLLLGGSWGVRQWLFPAQYRPMVIQEARHAQLDPLLVAAIIWCESGFNPTSCSSRDARGLMQVRPSVLEELERVNRVPEEATAEALYQSRANLQVGVTYLQYLLERARGNEERAARLRRWFGGDWWRPLCHAYHAGPTFVLRQLDSSRSLEEYERRLREYRPSSSQYADRVGRIYRLLHWMQRLCPYE